MVMDFGADTPISFAFCLLPFFFLIIKNYLKNLNGNAKQCGRKELRIKLI